MMKRYFSKNKIYGLCLQYWHISETLCVLLGVWAGTQENYLDEMCLLNRDSNTPVTPKD